MQTGTAGVIRGKPREKKQPSVRKTRKKKRAKPSAKIVQNAQQELF
jgi:hypothetical protein